MSEMVERVATAIAHADCEWQDTPGAQIMGWSETLARASIAAQREPTQAMVEAGAESIDVDLPDSDAFQQIRCIWPDMIDEALK